MADQHPPDQGDDPALLEAIQAASRIAGDGRQDPEPGDREPPPGPERVAVRFDAPPPRRLRLWLLISMLVVTSAGSAYLSLRSTGEPPPAEVEADLRWAVAQVVRRVEALRAQNGRLPLAADLQGLVNELVVYEPLADGYWVYGERGSVRVEYDGTEPLERWERLRTY